MIPNKPGDVFLEELSNIRFKSFLEEYLVKNVGSSVVSFCIVPSDHEVMTICAIPDSLLIHDPKVLPIFEDRLTSFMSMNTNNLHVACRPFQVVILHDFILLQDILNSLRCVK